MGTDFFNLLEKYGVEFKISKENLHVLVKKIHPIQLFATVIIHQSNMIMSMIS